jgi:hypothetical protein
MDLPALYDDDMHAWCLQQAAALRRLRASGARLPNELDLEHVAEEIEDLGNEQRFQVEGNLERALEHLLKLALLPGDAAQRHWRKEVAAFLAAARRRYARSMRRVIEPDKLWRQGCRLARLELGLDAAEPAGLPVSMPFTLEELLDEEADPRALAARLAALIATA